MGILIIRAPLLKDLYKPPRIVGNSHVKIHYVLYNTYHIPYTLYHILNTILVPRILGKSQVRVGAAYLVAGSQEAPGAPGSH